jgi:hypothetical protein
MTAYRQQALTCAALLERAMASRVAPNVDVSWCRDTSHYPLATVTIAGAPIAAAFARFMGGRS